MTKSAERMLMVTPSIHADLLVAAICASSANKTTQPAVRPRLGMHAAHQQLSYKPVNGKIDVTTMKAAFAAARVLPMRRVATVNSLNVQCGGGLVSSLSSDKWCDRDADVNNVIQMMVDTAP